MNKHYFRLVDHIDCMIGENAEINDDKDNFDLQLDSLDIDDQAEIVRLYIESEDKDVSECFLDPAQDMANDDVTFALLELLKNNNKDSKERIANLLVQRSINANKKQIQKIIDERCYYCFENLHDNDSDCDDSDYEPEWRRRA